MTREEAKQEIWKNGSLNTLSKVECDAIINKAFDDFESRTCESCKYRIYTDDNSCSNEVMKTYYGISFKSDFYCNRWEKKID